MVAASRLEPGGSAAGRGGAALCLCSCLSAQQHWQSILRQRDRIESSPRRSVGGDRPLELGAQVVDDALHLHHREVHAKAHPPAPAKGRELGRVATSKAARVKLVRLGEQLRAAVHVSDRAEDRAAPREAHARVLSVLCCLTRHASNRGGDSDHLLQDLLRVGHSLDVLPSEPLASRFCHSHLLCSDRLKDGRVLAEIPENPRESTGRCVVASEEEVDNDVAYLLVRHWLRVVS
mmetsp:Transcript_21651/g.51724  ORF Transcript_21651/g.51724 Transcript_21651/m.51724 type:complete len:234 (-) Transcript_21651:987-1688(-)